MNNEKLPELGKIHPEFFDKVIYPRLGVPDKNMIIGPQHGVDYGVLRLGNYCVAMSTDPFFIVPSFGFRKAAWFAFHIIFCDVAVSGLTPKYLAVDLNLPPEIKESELEEMWDSVHEEAKKYNITIPTGHTARYTGCNYPMIGGGTAFAIGDEKDLKGPHLVKPGDHIIITKGPAIEATGLLAVLFPDKFIKAGGNEFQQEAAAIFDQMSVMDECAVARKCEGIKCLHDATECGIWGGLYEMARAGKYGIKVDRDRIAVQKVIKMTSELFGFDPFAAISEGTLIAVVDSKYSDQFVKALNDSNVIASVVGEVTPVNEGLKISSGAESWELAHPKVDPYWKLAAEFSSKV